MKLNLYYIFLVVLVSCQNQNIASNCLFRIQADLKQSWQYSSDSSYHFFNDSLAQRMDYQYKSCLIGLSEKSVRKLFGKPDTIYTKSSAIAYYVTPSCKKNYNHCGYLIFNFDETQRVIQFRFLFNDFEVYY